MCCPQKLLQSVPPEGGFALRSSMDLFLYISACILFIFVTYVLLFAWVVVLACCVVMTVFYTMSWGVCNTDEIGWDEGTIDFYPFHFMFPVGKQSICYIRFEAVIGFFQRKFHPLHSLSEQLALWSKLLPKRLHEPRVSNACELQEYVQQTRDKRRILGCVNSASFLHLAAERSLHLFFSCL